MSTIVSPIRAGDGDPRHGTLNGYSNHGCRCARCTTANADYARNRLRRLGIPPRPPRGSNITHGLRGTYSKYGCRCEPCTRAEREYRYSYRHRVAS